MTESEGIQSGGAALAARGVRRGGAILERLEPRRMLSGRVLLSHVPFVGPLPYLNVPGTPLRTNRAMPTTEPMSVMAARDGQKLLLEPASDLTVGGSFPGIGIADQISAFGAGSSPPDMAGAIGPSHFVEMLNGSVAIYTRAGVRLSHVSLASFFNVTVGATTYPRGGAFSPRVLYDRRSERFFASALEINGSSANNIILAVSRTSDPTGTWDKYLIPVGEAASLTDYANLGVDDNGVYFGMTIYHQPDVGLPKIAATAKASLLSATPSLSTVYQFSNVTGMYSSPQPAINFDAIGASARAWFVASSDSTFANVNYRTLTWSGGVATLSAISSALTTPAYALPLNFIPSGSTTAIDAGDDRLRPSCRQST